jgi:EmrB/QacA subfamily drug resistance transporter
MIVYGRARWVALAVVCTGSLMNVLDTTIVGVALPAMQRSLGFSTDSLAWVVNAYLLTYGGFILLGGRLGDLLGHRRMFVAGTGVFVLASLACGVATEQGSLVVARAVQGLGGALVSAIALSLVVSLFPEPAARATAVGVLGFVGAGGGSLGVLLGGVLTSTLNWHWIFLVNVPIGVSVCLLSLRLLPHAAASGSGRRPLDLAGAGLVTGALTVVVYAVVHAGQAGWISTRTDGALAFAVLLLGAFAAVESRARFPLVPLRLFRLRNLRTASAIGVLWSAAMFAWFFLTALYLQLVLGYSPLQTGLAFLPGSLVMGVSSVAISARLVSRWGIKPVLAAGLLVAAAGLALLACAPVGGHFVSDVLPGTFLLGLGAGTAVNPVLLAAMDEVRETESGLASGVVNTSFVMGGALGLSVFAGIATSHVHHLRAVGQGQLAALTGGYHAAFLASAVSTLLAALISVGLRGPARSARPGPDNAVDCEPVPAGTAI